MAETIKQNNPEPFSMDRTQTYIAMCDQAREIQSSWQQEYGDFYADPDKRIACWLPQHKTSGRMKCGYWISAENKVIHVCRYTWLPRLDQLIEAAQVTGKRYEVVTQDFFDWAKKPYGKRGAKPGGRFSTLEQLWLAYIMSTKYGKKWNGSNWVRSDDP